MASMKREAVGKNRPLHRRWKHISTSLLFNVQERRDRTRALLEGSNRKAALLPLGTQDVVRRLEKMRQPEEIMDDKDTAKAEGLNREKAGFEGTARNEIYDSSSIPKSYDEWAEEGFSIVCWRPLLVADLYHPLEARQKYFRAKYSLASKQAAYREKENISPDQEQGDEKKEDEKQEEEKKEEETNLITELA